MNRYPCKIGRLPDQLVNLPHQKEIIRGGMDIGEVDTASIDSDDSALLALRQIIHDRGGRLNGRRAAYADQDHTFGKGSVFPHTDATYGLIAAAYVATLPMDGRSGWGMVPESQECWLMTPQRQLCLMPGDVVLFDSDREHAWMSNCRWCLINQRVSRRWKWAA